MAEFKGTYTTGRTADSRTLDVEGKYINTEIKALMDRATFDAAQDDTVHLGNLPSHAVLSMPVQDLRHTAFGASVVLDIGIAADASLGITGKEDVLASNLNVAAAGTKDPTAAIAIADYGKPLWELAGLTEDPKVKLKIIATLQGANPASGTLAWTIGFVSG